MSLSLQGTRSGGAAVRPVPLGQATWKSLHVGSDLVNTLRPLGSPQTQTMRRAARAGVLEGPRSVGWQAGGDGHAPFLDSAIEGLSERISAYRLFRLDSC